MSVWVEFSYASGRESGDNQHNYMRTGIDHNQLENLDRAVKLHATSIAAKNFLVKQHPDWQLLVDPSKRSPYCCGPDTVLYKANWLWGFEVIVNDNKAYQASETTVIETVNFPDWLNQTADIAGQKGLTSLKNYLRNQANARTTGRKITRLVTNAGSGAGSLAKDNYLASGRKTLARQTLVLIDNDQQILQQSGVCPTFISEYLQKQNIYQDIYWIEGSQPFAPELLHDWAKQWINIITPISPIERAKHLHNITDGHQHAYFLKALRDFQLFAQQAITEKVLLMMRVI